MTKTWAKAPDFTDQGARAAKLHAETAADKQLYTTGGLHPLDCRTCGTQVLVKKYSDQHTSIQWATDPVSSCPELRAGEEAGRASAQQDTCPKLRASITYAVAEGLLEVGESAPEEPSD